MGTEPLRGGGSGKSLMKVQELEGWVGFTQVKQTEMSIPGRETKDRGPQSMSKTKTLDPL
jgi:hypothetical protein